MMARRKANPFAEKIRALPHHALIKRDEPFGRVDSDEIDATCARIAARADYCSYAGARGEENECKVLCFDTPEKAREMQAWIDEAPGAEPNAVHDLGDLNGLHNDDLRKVRDNGEVVVANHQDVVVGWFLRPCIHSSGTLRR